MKVYLYVIAIWSRKREEIWFKHWAVTADTTSAAAVRGTQLARADGILPLSVDETANDYVIEVGFTTEP